MPRRRKPLQTKFFSPKEEIDLCIERFNELYPTDADKAESIYRSLTLNGFRCNCGMLILTRKNGERKAKCSGCKKTVSVTVNTLFHGMRRPSAYACGMFLFGEGVSISGNDFALRNGISQSQGSIILHTLSAAVVMEMCGAPELLTAALLEPVGKRSNETPARAHPKAEQIEAEKRAAKSGATKGNKNPRQALEKLPTRDPDKLIFSLLKAESLQPDEISKRVLLSITEVACSLTMLELDGFVKPVAGNRFEALVAPENSVVQMIKEPARKRIKNFVAFIKKTFHGISRKYMQRYFARYWCFIDRERWSFESMLELCARAPYQSYAQLTGYVTPLSVKVVLAV
ncbi:MAG TPA: hypothetical protein EYN91_12510 [Candidatus Melainabacteria bacterium]|jgi:hypothetical protein|nr:hypothetical protein [Candidatus Melainabacteria bacterium]HIN65795.1 hypothetical protein [Candidatus Obscuribacterales bacterium]